MDFSTYSIYTMRHTDVLDDKFDKGGAGKLNEAKRWTTGFDLFQQAVKNGESMPIIFSSADVTDRLLYWGILSDIQISDLNADEPRTDFAFTQLRKVAGVVLLDALRLRSSGQQLKKTDIRPYRICFTPEFILRSSTDSS